MARYSKCAGKKIVSSSPWPRSQWFVVSCVASSVMFLILMKKLWFFRTGGSGRVAALVHTLIWKCLGWSSIYRCWQMSQRNEHCHLVVNINNYINTLSQITTPIVRIQCLELFCTVVIGTSNGCPVASVFFSCLLVLVISERVWIIEYYMKILTSRQIFLYSLKTSWHP